MLNLRAQKVLLLTLYRGGWPSYLGADGIHDRNDGMGESDKLLLRSLRDLLL